MSEKPDTPEEFSEGLAWKAMYEADVHRRYYGTVCDRLRRVNTRMVIAAWGTSLVASVLAIWTSVPIELSVGGIIVAAAMTTLRDVLRIPERVSEARYILMGTNREYDKMRLLWETGGGYRPQAEYESFRNVSRLHDFTNEMVDGKVLEDAEDASQKYHKDIEQRKRELIHA